MRGENEMIMKTKTRGPAPTAEKPRGMDLALMERGVRMILRGAGENPDRAGLKETPARVARMYREILGGLHENPEIHLRTVHKEKHDEMVLIKNIPLYSMCEHHMLPFAGVAHIAYIPKNGRIVGLSKLARVVEGLSRRLQVQERLTKQTADMIMDHLDPQGVMVVVEAEHMCMSMRGAKKPKSITVTSAVRGIFRTHPVTRAEAITLIRGGLSGGKEV
jgi:GTP cyclohydrolase I